MDKVLIVAQNHFDTECGDLRSMSCDVVKESYLRGFRKGVDKAKAMYRDCVRVIRCSDCRYGRVVHDYWSCMDGQIECTLCLDVDEESGVESGFSSYHDSEYYCASAERRKK